MARFPATNPSPRSCSQLLLCSQSPQLNLPTFNNHGASFLVVFSILIISALGTAFLFHASDCWKLITDHFEDTPPYDDDSDQLAVHEKVPRKTITPAILLRASSPNTIPPTNPRSSPSTLPKSPCASKHFASTTKPPKKQFRIPYRFLHHRSLLLDLFKRYLDHISWTPE